MQPPPPPPPPTPKNKRYLRRKRSKAAATGKAVVDLAGIPRRNAAVHAAYQMYMEDPDATLHDIWRHGKLRPRDPDSPLICDCIDKNTRHSNARRDSRSNILGRQ